MQSDTNLWQVALQIVYDPGLQGVVQDGLGGSMFCVTGQMAAGTCKFRHEDLQRLFLTDGSTMCCRLSTPFDIGFSERFLSASFQAFSTASGNFMP